MARQMLTEDAAPLRSLLHEMNWLLFLAPTLRKMLDRVEEAR